MKELHLSSKNDRNLLITTFAPNHFLLAKNDRQSSETKAFLGQHALSKQSSETKVLFGQHALAKSQTSEIRSPRATRPGHEPNLGETLCNKLSKVLKQSTIKSRQTLSSEN